MKILVFSDSHGSPKEMIDTVRLHLNCGGVDHVFFLGDGVRDFLSLIEQFPDVPADYVFGNCDGGIVLPAGHRTPAYEHLVSVGEKKFLIMHGHRYDVKTTYQHAADHAISQGADVLLFGHTHRAEDVTIDGTDGGHVRMINPGSCRAFGLFPSYALINIEGGQIVCGFGEP